MPDFIVHQKELLPHLIEAIANGEVDYNEADAILSRYGYRPITVGKPTPFKSARFVLDALVITLADGTQMRIDRDLQLLRSGGDDSPMRQLIEGRAGHLTKAADAAFAEAEELLK